MAVDYYHRVLVSGLPADVVTFRRRVARRVRRPAVGRVIRATTMQVPFSFEAIFEQCPRLIAVFESIPCDPYDLAVWPTQRLPDGRALVRYAFQTRNLEMQEIVAELSRVFRSLWLALVTFCLDDSSIDVYVSSRGRTRAWHLPEARQEKHWARVQREMSLSEEELYESDAARDLAESRMLDDALAWAERCVAGRWRRRQGRRAFAGGVHRANWEPSRMVRGLLDEKYRVAAEIAVRSRRGASGGRQRTTGKQGRRRDPTVR